MFSRGYEEPYFLAIDTIMFWYPISLVVPKIPNIPFMDIVTTYLYRLTNSDIRMKIHEIFKMPKTFILIM